MLSEDEVVRLAAAHLAPRKDTDTTSTMGAGNDDLEAGRGYLAAMVATGLAVPGWPVEHGGLGASAAEVRTVTQVLRRFRVPDLYPFTIGIRMVGPALVTHGTEAQRARWMPPIATGQEIWCQMFSEPEAGSDLANVGTAARQVEGGWLLEGQKVWTSRGSYAAWGICLARTDPEVPKHQGLTMFALRMDSPGMDVRPLRQMNGDDHFSEVFLTGVVVPDDQRIAAVGEGWAVAHTVLAHERAGADRSAPQAGGPHRLPLWMAELAGSGRLGDPVLRDRAVRLYCQEEVLRLTQERAAATARSGGKPGAQSSGLKLQGAATSKQRAALVLDAQGAAGMLAGTDAHLQFLTAPSMSIRGGTDEIQRNIVGERVLGLPAEPRVDRDVPWTLSRQGRTRPA